MEKLQILYQDKYLAVIYKPEGLLSVPFAGFKGRTAQGILEEQLRRRGVVNKSHHPFAVHRLDRDTSGVMMFALTEAAQKKIMDSWHQMVTGRVYRALCEKNPRLRIFDFELQEEGLIDAPLAKNSYNEGFVPRAGALDKNGKPFCTESARTCYKKLGESKQYCLFELSLDTGRKNQVRAHLAAAGYPVLGDKSRRAAKNPLNRLCLHARTLEFIHPFTNEKMRFEIPEPSEWACLAGIAENQRAGGFHNLFDSVDKS